MQCIDARDLLSAYIDDVLDPRERFEVEKHIKSCSACRQELDELKETVRLLKSLGELAPPVAFRQELMAKISENSVAPMVVLPTAKSKENSKFLQLFQRYRTIVAAAVIIGIGISIGTYQLTLGPKGGGLEIAGKTDMYSYSQSPNQESNQSSDQTKTFKAYQAGGGESAQPDRQIKDHVDTNPNPETARENDKGISAGKRRAVEDESQIKAKTAPPAAGLLAETPNGKNTAGGSNSVQGQPSLGDSAAEEPALGGPEMGITSEGVSGQDQDSQQQAKRGELQEKAQKIIKNADIRMEVENYKEFNSKLRMETEQHLGYIENSSEDLGEKTSANFVIRVPMDNFTGLMTKIEKMGYVTATNVSGNDVSGEYIDTEARIRNLAVQEQRLLALINRAGSLGDVVTLENELSRVRSEIETLQGRINALDDMIAYSTIRLSVSEKGKASITPPKGVMGKTLDNIKRSSSAIMNMFGSIVTFTGWVAPWAALIGGAGGTVVYIGKAASRNKENEDGQHP